MARWHEVTALNCHAGLKNIDDHNNSTRRKSTT